MLLSPLLFIPKKRYGFLVTDLTATLAKFDAVFGMHYFRLVIRALFIDLMRTKIGTLQTTDAFIVVYYRVPVSSHFIPCFL